MTEYSDMVEEARIRLQAMEWAKQATSIQGSNGIIETRFNNGDVHYQENKKGGKSWTLYKRLPKKTLLDRFLKAYPNSTPKKKR
tara:strand:+ start:260 stop:511 length:252 start_codon:yes stop_codon:yes gene_type:complete